MARRDSFSPKGIMSSDIFRQDLLLVRPAFVHKQYACPALAEVLEEIPYVSEGKRQLLLE
ncbi:hypothetical protein GGE24_007611 [Bradyrhizobium centrosematis]|nr:hypothetical protein [Bradyrhizobium centrosematis]MCS3778235.1 hypothetical protein [Bradyrhizobium centrosematis]